MFFSCQIQHMPAGLLLHFFLCSFFSSPAREFFSRFYCSSRFRFYLYLPVPEQSIPKKMEWIKWYCNRTFVSLMLLPRKCTTIFFLGKVIICTMLFAFVMMNAVLFTRMKWRPCAGGKVQWKPNNMIAGR